MTLSPLKEPDLDGVSMFLGFTSRATIIFWRSARKCPGFSPDIDTSNVCSTWLKYDNIVTVIYRNKAQINMVVSYLIISDFRAIFSYRQHANNWRIVRAKYLSLSYLSQIGRKGKGKATTIRRLLWLCNGGTNYNYCWIQTNLDFIF